MSENTAVVKAGTEQDVCSKVIDQMRDQWARVLPKICTPERFARMALSCVRKNATLAEALTTPGGKASVLSAFMTCAELGIEPDGRRAHLIAFKNNKQQSYDITLIIDYKGVAELVMRSGLVANIHADKICENDVFEVNKGRIINHIPNYKAPRGAAYAYYANITFKDGTEKSEIMTLDEVTAISKRSKAVQNYDKRKANGDWAAETPWQTDFDEMAKKTVFKRGSKWVPLSPEVRDAVEKDDEDYIDISATAVPEKPRRSLLEKPKEKVIAENAEQDQEPEKPAELKTESKPEASQGTGIAALFEGQHATFQQVESFFKKTGKLGMTMSLEKNPTLCGYVRKNLDKVINDVVDYMAKEGGK